MSGRAMIALAALTIGAEPAAAQWSFDWGAQAIPAFTETNVVPGDRSLGEVRVIQPMLMLDASALGGRLRLLTAVDFEKYTIPHGELAPGDWGEGFEDRRHPHTLVHQLMLVAPDIVGNRKGSIRLSLAAGKGFVPFGSDDPMSRPAVRFPVNHHLSQILERAVGIAGVRAGPVLVEGALFNGDEPVSPGSWPALRRFGDSWASRLTITPISGLETQASYAWVHSPENRPGAGPDDAKTSASARWERGRWYGLVEWARTSTAHGTFVFRSVLTEGAVALPHQRPYLRLERTERPEEERLFSSPFRTRRPLFENSILGITRWTVLTAGNSLEIWNDRPVRFAPFVEGSYLWIARAGGGVFDPEIWYGRQQGAILTVGIRIGAGMHMPRMGRYAGNGADDMHMSMRHAGDPS